MNTAIEPLREVPLPKSLKVLRVTRGWAVAEFSQCLIVIWREQMTLEPVLLRESALRDLVARHAGHCASIELIEATSPPPPTELRPTAMRVFAELAQNLSCIALVLEGTSLRQTLNRAIITGMAFLVPQPLPTRVFKHLEAMSEWVKPATGITSPSFNAEVTVVVAHLRSLISTSDAAA